MFPSRLSCVSPEDTMTPFNLERAVKNVSELGLRTPKQEQGSHIRPGSTTGAVGSNPTFTMQTSFFQSAPFVFTVTANQRATWWPDNQQSTFHTYHYSSSKKKKNKARRKGAEEDCSWVATAVFLLLQAKKTLQDVTISLFCRLQTGSVFKFYHPVHKKVPKTKNWI